MKKYSMSQICFYSLLCLVVTALMVISLWNQGMINGGEYSSLSFIEVLRELGVLLLFGAILPLAYYLYHTVYKNIKQFGMSYLRVLLNGYRKELLACYCVVLAVFLMQDLMPVFALFFVPLGIVFLLPITVFVMLMDRYEHCINSKLFLSMSSL